MVKTDFGEYTRYKCWTTTGEFTQLIAEHHVWRSGMFKALVKTEDTGNVVVEALDDTGRILPPKRYKSMARIRDKDLQHKLKILLWVDESDQNPREGIGTRIGKHNFWIEK